MKAKPGKVVASRPTVSVIGIGGAGCSIVTYLSQAGIAGAKTIAAATDIDHLVLQRADRRILIGKKTCRGKGCGGLPETGEKCARESRRHIRKELKGSDIVFIVAGLGGGTGSGSAPVVAEIAHKLGALTIACMTLPFEVEHLRRETARESIKALLELCDSVVLLDNSRLCRASGKLPLKTAFAAANGLIGAFIRGITETISQPSLVNLDLGDLKSVLEKGGISSFGIGEAEGFDRVEKAIARAVKAPLLNIPQRSCAHGLLIQITGGKDMTLDEVAKVGELMVQHVPCIGKIIWGANVDDSMDGRIRVMALFAGVGDLLSIPSP